MKKYIALAAVAAMMASCADNTVKTEIQDDIVEIGFANSFVDNATKADITMDWMKTVNATNGKFGVFGYKGTTSIFSNEKVTYEDRPTNHGKTPDWFHPTVRYWDKSATNYSFYAYAPYMTSGVSESNGVITFSNLSIFKEISATGVDDICLATPVQNIGYKDCLDASSTLDGHVTFTFNHILAKIAFKFKTNIPEINTSDKTGATITVTKVELATPVGTDASWSQTNNSGIAGTTSYTTYTANSTTTDGVTTYNYNLTQYDNATGAALTSEASTLTNGKEYAVVPVNATKTSHAINVKVTYNIEYGDGVKETGCVATGAIKDGAATPSDIAFASNTLYNVTVTVGPATIEFDVDKVESYTENNAANVTVQ